MASASKTATGLGGAGVSPAIAVGKTTLAHGGASISAHGHGVSFGMASARREAYVINHWPLARARLTAWNNGHALCAQVG